MRGPKNAASRWQPYVEVVGVVDRCRRRLYDWQHRRRVLAARRQMALGDDGAHFKTSDRYVAAAERDGADVATPVPVPRRNMSDAEGLEYYIKFPSSNFNYNSQHCDGDYVFVVNEDKIPVILLFGWAGCQDKYLAKYSQIYEEKGLITLRYIAPVKCLFWKRYHMIAIGQKLVKLLLDLNFETHPVIVHCFSNGGAFLYQNFSMALQDSPKPIQIKGVIFDSAPGKRRILSLYKAISAILGGNMLYNFPMSFLITMVCSMIWICEIINKYVNPKKCIQSDPFQKLKCERNMWPQHFIYSKADDLIPYQDVEHFSLHREKLGVDVTELRFEESPHVKHFSYHRDSYISSVYNFINKCLNGKN